MAQDGLAAFEPAFVDELAVILRWAFDYMQRERRRASRVERNWLRDETGGSVYLRLSTRADRAAAARDDGGALPRHRRRRLLAAPARARTPRSSSPIPGAVAPEAIEAVGLMAEDRRDVGLLAVTSADRLNAGWTAAQRARERGLVHARSHVERLLADLPPHCGSSPCSTATRRRSPGSASVAGHRTRSLGVEHFGQTGTIADLYRHYGIDAKASSPRPR